MPILISMEGDQSRPSGITELLADILTSSERIFSLIEKDKHKESADELEKVLFKMKKAMFITPKNPEEIERAKESLEKIKMKFEVLRRYYELITLIWDEANSVSSKEFKQGTLVNKLT